MTQQTDQFHFPADFTWGMATAAYQIEGGANEDGRGESIWDRFSHTPGMIKDGSTGDVACDSYHLYEQDIALLKTLNVNAYRFSMAWSRVIPQGTGAVNSRGLEYYDKLVDQLLAAGIQPYITLYHWDLPQALQDRGGWTNRDTIAAFTDYAVLAVQKLGDRVQHWMTHNEPWCVSLLGNYIGLFAPGLHDLKTALQVAHNVLVSHGTAVSAMRGAVSHDLKIGIAPNMEPAYPYSQDPADIAAAQREDGWFNRWFLDPLAGRGYPQDMWQYYGDAVPEVGGNDLAVIAAPIDFIGVNYYNRCIAKDNPQGTVPQVAHMTDSTRPRTQDREIYPEGLYDVLMRLHRDYKFQSIYITENGAAYPDVVAPDGCVHDPERIAFLQQHFTQTVRAIKDGVPLKGYFVWTLMDNFEWAFGYTIRYGIAYTDFQTQQRILKDSGHWLSKVIGKR